MSRARWEQPGEVEGQQRPEWLKQWWGRVAVRGRIRGVTWGHWHDSVTYLKEMEGPSTCGSTKTSRPG